MRPAESTSRGAQKPARVRASWGRGAQQMDVNIFYVTFKLDVFLLRFTEQPKIKETVAYKVIA